MKNLLLLSIVLILAPTLLDGEIENKQIVPAGTIVTTQPKVDKPASKTALVKAISTNIAILARDTFKIASNFKEIKQSAKRLKPDVECLTDPKSESCKGISCATVSKCVGTTLSDLLRVTYPFLKAILGSVDDEDNVKPGSLFAIVDSTEKIPGVIPGSLYTKLNVGHYKPNVDAVVSKLGKFRDDLPKLTKGFHEAMAMLNGIVLLLNPEMLIESMPIKPLPAVQELENSTELSKNLIDDVDTVLALPAPEVVPT